MGASSIRRQLLSLALMPLSLTILAVSVLAVVASLEDIESRLKQRGQDIGKQAVLMSEFYFYTGDQLQLNNVAAIVAGLEGVSSIRFLNAQGEVMVKRRNDAADKGLDDQHLFVIPIYSKGISLDEVAQLAGAQTELSEKLGSIEISLSKAALTPLREAAYMRILLVALGALLLGVLMVYLFGRRLSAALSETIEAAKSVKRGNMNSRAPENGEGEILEFQKVFNRMVGSVQQNEVQLQDRINSATRSLNETVAELSQSNRELAATRQATIELERSKAISDERARIMKDMHDGIGGQLVASLALIEKEQNSEIRANISSTLRECLDDLRLIILSLNMRDSTVSAVLADFKYRVHKKLQKLEIELIWEVDDIADHISLQPQQSLHLLRILQEVFTNTLKHAGASQIHLRLTSEQGKVRLSIDDDGIFTLDEEQRDCHGLNNMQWRAAELGGNLTVACNEAGGCAVRLDFAAADLSEVP
ncbi:MAG: hypothetical protein OIF35_12125 [Cellvibrionaceae bacterium]|nr:hypothetical protein [Cellvibrionaceae bacterium]